MCTRYVVLAGVPTSVVDKVKECFFTVYFVFILRFPLEGVKGYGLYPPGLSVTSAWKVEGQVKG